MAIGGVSARCSTSAKLTAASTSSVRHLAALLGSAARAPAICAELRATP